MTDAGPSLLDTSILIAAGADSVALPIAAAISVITLGELRARRGPRP